MNTFTQALQSIDTAILLFINGKNSPFLDQVMMVISGRFTWIPLYLLFAILIIKDYGKTGWLIILFAILAVVASDQVSNLIKDFVMRPRPNHAGIPNLHYEPDFGGVSPYGFVSNHAANATSLAIYLTLLYRNKFVTWGLLCWVLLLCYSRVYLGVHYPSDVFCGIVLGIIIGSLASYFCKLIERGTSFTDN
jgi:undecaprenyl-diphosphatase